MYALADHRLRLPLKGIDLKALCQQVITTKTFSKVCDHGTKGRKRPS